MSFEHPYCGGKHDKVAEARECEKANPKAAPAEAPAKREPSPAMLRMIRALLNHRNTPQAFADRVKEYLDGNKFTYVGAHRTIDKLKEFPERADDVPAQNVTTRDQIAEGVYRNPDTGEMYVVRHPINRPDGHLYASILIIREQPIFENGKMVKAAKVGFEYVKGGMRMLHPSWRLTREQSDQFGEMYGACSKCGSELSKESSIKQSMGDICAAKQWGEDK